MTVADLIWLAMASLTRDNPDRAGFSVDEIRRRMSELEPTHGFTEAPLKDLEICLNADGSYRIVRGASGATGSVVPDLNAIPEKYRELAAWFRDVYSRPPKTPPEQDPLLALSGLGKDLWRDLGGGEKFIRELRADWYGV
jgi:hypothetical protein